MDQEVMLRPPGGTFNRWALWIPRREGTQLTKSLVAWCGEHRSHVSGVRTGRGLQGTLGDIHTLA